MVSFGLFRHDREDVSVIVHLDQTSEMQSVNVDLPAGIADLTPGARALLVLDVVHAAMLRLAQARGWDTGMLDAARDHCLAQGLQFGWSSPWKASPDRTRRARAVYRLHDDGYGRVHLEIAARDGTVLTRSPQALAFSTAEGFRRSAATLRWTDRFTVELAPYDGLDGPTAARLTWTAQAPSAPAPDAAESAESPDTARPAVRVEGRGVTAHEQPPELLVIGGGPTDGVNLNYARALNELLDQLAEPQWQQWWSAADRTVCEIWYWHDVTAPRTVVRRGKTKLTAKIERPARSTHGPGDPCDLARQDVEQLITAIRTRMALTDPPRLLDPARPDSPDPGPRA